MFTKPRYIHKQTPDGRKNGFSVLLTPVDNPNEVGVCVTFCSKNDQYCKRTARETLRSIIPTPMPVLEVPKALAECMAYAHGLPIGKILPHVERARSNQWAWVWKYFL